MSKQLYKRTGWLFVVLAVLLTSACGNRYPEETQKAYQAVNKRLELLKNELDRGTLRNAIITKTYAQQLKAINPAMSDVADTLHNDATSNGVPYQSLLKRTRAVNKNPETKQAYATSIDELNGIYVASDGLIFNESLIDLVNTLADLSNGKLARVNIPKSDAASNSASSGGKVPGSYLVGNPNYGQWSTNSSGSSIWAWYGQYAFFSALMRPRYGYYGGPIGYGSWYSQPRHSYYHDYGRSSYGTSGDRDGWRKGSQNLKKKGITPSKPKKDYRSRATAKRQSTYAYGRSSSNKQYGAKSQASNRYGSGGVTKRSSSYGGYQSSGFRGSSSGSRSFRGGK